MNTYLTKSVLEFLSSNNVMPKYGFPVDIVELTILHHGEEARNISLSRDLKMAISEFYQEMKLTAVYTIMMKMTSMFHQSCCLMMCLEEQDMLKRYQKILQMC